MQHNLTLIDIEVFNFQLVMEKSFTINIISEVFNFQLVMEKSFTINITSSCARSARFATFAKSSLRSPCRGTLKLILCCMPDCSHPVIAMGTVVPMSKVEGSLI